ncbi:YdcF family protein [Actinomadura syzygii]|uniref:YdcF family protein n=1 Tax=Actinomadura syzygii TaxID=1427538 RepID=A0A5D0UCS9_9ACTN|nr:YdcF family protein [Actinomadura syzygii]TYC15425.1 YdcF family protein [Actinomadura syzygii]
MIDTVTAEQLPEITRFVDVHAPPPDGEPSACFLFGTNQLPPVDIAADRYHRGLAPLIIATGGVNRHNGIVEGRMFRELLIERGVPADVIRVEDRSANTWQNVELALPFLREVLASGLAVTAVCKWYHRRAIHVMKTVVPATGPLHAIGWDPVYSGRRVTRQDWPDIPAGRRRVIREWGEVVRRVAESSFAAADLSGGAWH